jgi:photosystem II stability/assembly factor-like uncharacterized protein
MTRSGPPRCALRASGEGASYISGVAPHTPHDDVYDIALSPEFAIDGVVFVLCRDMFLKSSDRGRTWQNIVYGLNNLWQFFTDKTQRFSLDMSVTDKRVMFFASRGDGVYKSTDQGWSWTKISVSKRDARISLVAISPHSSDRVLAVSATDGLYGTTDGGATWSPVLVTETPITAVAYAPDRDGVVIVGDDEGMLRLSADDGATWRTTRLADVGQIRSIAISPTFSSDGTIIVGTALSGVYKSTDGGSWFAVKNVGLADTSISSVVFSPAYATDASIWVSTWSGGVFASCDRGESWTHSSVGLTRNTQKYEARYAKRPHFGRVVAAQGDATDQGRTLFLAGFDGFFCSTNGGRTWSELETLPSTLAISVAVSPDFARDSSVAATTYINGAYISEDRGDTWIAINKGLEERGFMQQKPDRIARLFGIAFSPAYASDQCLLCSNWTYFLQSTTRGRQWIRRSLSSEKLPLQQFVMCVSPAYGRDGTIFFGNRFGEIWKSVDGGATFSIASKLGGQIRAFAISPSFGTDDTIFAAAATSPDDIYVSLDGGVTWSPTGPGSETLTHLAISPTFGIDHTLFAGTRRGIFVTRDAGSTWSRVEDAAYGTRSNIEAAAVSPNYATDGTLLVSVAGKGLFKSIDGGGKFEAVGEDLLRRNVIFANIPNAVASPLVFSPDYGNDQTVFGYAPSGFFRSTDGGEHWTDITPPTTTHRMPTRIVPTPKADHSEIVQGAPGSEGLRPALLDLRGRYSSATRGANSPIWTRLTRLLRSKPR